MIKLALLSAACGAMLAQAAVAQNATTVPVGAMTIDFPATGTSPATTAKYISIPLHDTAIFAGKPTAVTSNTLTFSGVSWTTNPSQFGATPANHIVRIMSGQQAGRILQITANTSNSVTVSITDRTLQSTSLDFSGFAITANDTVEIVQCDTLSGLFGDGTTGNPLLLVGGTNTFLADTVSIQDRVTGRSTAYFFNNSSGVNQWRRGTNNTSFSDLPIYPDDALLVVRRANRNASQLILTGRVPVVPPLLKSLPGGFSLTCLGVPVDVSLSNLGISGGWSDGNSIFVSDTLSVFNAQTNRFAAYFRRSSDATWRASASSTAPDVSSTILPAGSAVGVLERTSSVTGAQSFNRITLPYSL